MHVFIIYYSTGLLVGVNITIILFINNSVLDTEWKKHDDIHRFGIVHGQTESPDLSQRQSIH